MDINNLKGLMEAYQQVNAPQEVNEASYSAKAARAGKDIGKPGKAFAKIAKEAGERYGSKERGEKVAGAVLAKLRKEGLDIFDIVLEFLQAEGYAETLEEAQWMMANVLDEETIDMIIGEGMTMKDFKKKRSALKQKEKRSADKLSPTRRKNIHTDRLSPERAARHRANVDPDFEGDDERNYPGGKLRAKKVRKAKALGELD